VTIDVRRDVADRDVGHTALKAAYATLVVGVLYALVSAYWAMGGTALLNTVGGAFQAQGNTDNPSVVLAVWAAVILKVIAAALPLVAVRTRTRPRWGPTVRLMAWIEAGILTIYGLVLTAVGLLVQAGAIHVSATADHRALAWHAYLWDPWFLVWGLLVTYGLRITGTQPRQPEVRPTGRL